MKKIVSSEEQMREIVNYKHRFIIEGQEIELTINFKNGYWTSDITKGKTGIGNCSGGKYKSLDEYIKDQEREHRYAFNFYNHGYSYAKNIC